MIVADRQARGPFGSLEALDRVPGVGPGLLAAIREHARFSAPPPASLPVLPSDPTRNAEQPAPSAARGGTRNAPELGTRSPQPILDLNTASAADLESLPKVGPALATRIVAFREKYGPFPAVDSLVRVPGIGPATLALLRGRVMVR
ncbi:MAG: helix-hairpin-helix domain-containing protein [Gemmatimonadales bacterium]